MSLQSISREIQFHILSFCNSKDLKVVQRLSRAWCQMACNDLLWQNLFTLRFNETPLQKNQSKEEFRKRMNPVCLQESGQLRKAVTSFFCDLKWDTKRQFICLFPKEPTYSINLQQSFGPKRGTAEGFEGLADEVEYYEFTADISPGVPADQVVKIENPIKCPGPWLNPSTVSFIPSDEQGIPLFESNSWTTARNPKVHLAIMQEFVSGKIEEVDVGYGNTLGYLSAVNNWKSPFTLFCTQGNSGRPIWLGLIPNNQDFKFVSIDSKGSVTSYEKGNNRNLIPYWTYKAPGQKALDSNILEFPIEFPPKS